MSKPTEDVTNYLVRWGCRACPGLPCIAYIPADKEPKYCCISGKKEPNWIKEGVDCENKRAFRQDS